MNEYRIRVRIFSGIILLVLSILGFRLAQLQVLNTEEYAGESRQTAVRERIVEPARGSIYDRDGRLMVDNEPTYTITLTPRYFRADRSLKEPKRKAILDKRIDLLSDLLRVPDSVVTQKLEEASRWSQFRPTRAFREVPFAAFSRVQENLYRLPGVAYEVEQNRQYRTDAKAAHALGYVREITRAELDRLRDEGYRMGDRIGKTGIERNYESELRGRQGSEFKLVNIRGMELRPFQDGAEDTPPKSGYDLYTTLDAKVQALAETLLVNKRGGIVALDPNTGGIISIASAPDFSPEIFSKEIDPETWDYLNNSPQKPLFNRATMMGKPPGSTWKPLMSLAGLDSGTITEDTKLNCSGVFYLGNHGFKNFGRESLGMIDVETAIENSCNTFFFRLMMKLDVDTWAKYARMFGFGQRIPMDIGEQSAGLIPDSSYFNRVYGRWTAGYTVNLGIGQGDMVVTPMQLARYVAAVANKGTLQTPHLVQKIVDPETGREMRLKLPVPKDIPIPEKHFNTVHRGMRRVVENGTAAYVQVPGIKAGAKTGTAENPHGEDHSVFIMFAPIDDPQIAVASIIENAGYGASVSGPIVSLMVEKYLTGKITKGAEGQYRYRRAMNARSQPIEED